RSDRRRIRRLGPGPWVPSADLHREPGRDAGLVGTVCPDRDGRDLVRHRLQAGAPGDPLAHLGACRGCRRLSILNRRCEMNILRPGIAAAAAVLLAVLLAALPRPPGPADAVSFRLDWTLSGYHLPF